MDAPARDLWTLFEVGSLGGLSDGQLLDHFVERREPAVFEAIVRRHGPMVWGVCRQVLRDHHDAEDAFQATFLVLARRATSVRPREKLGHWLYGVAYRTARKARAMRARRRAREGRVPDPPEPEAAPREPGEDPTELLDEELSRLPEKYRVAIVLCDLEGRTHREAAGRLGWPIGTVSSRLSRARAMLARRLARRGLSPSAGSLAVLLARDPASAGMPTRLIGPTARAARLSAAGETVNGGMAAVEVVALTREVLKMMSLSKLEVAAATLPLALALATGGAGLALQAQAVQPGPKDERPRQPELQRPRDVDRRAVITPRNVAGLATIARLDKDDVYGIAWGPARDRMGVVGWEAPVEVRDVASLALRDTIGEGKKIIHFAFSPRRGVVAYSENDGSNTVTILDRAPVRTIRLDAGGDQPGVVFSPDGNLLATGGYGTSVRLWRVEDGRLIRTFDAGPGKGGLTPEFSPDGRLLAVGHRNSTTGLFDVATEDLLFRLPKRMSQELRFSPDGRTLAVAYVDASIALWKVADGSLIAERPTKAEELYTVDWSPDGSLLATAGLRGAITIWDPRDLSVLRELPAPEWVIRVKFSPDGSNLLWAGGARVQGGERRLEILGIKASPESPPSRPGR